MMRRTEFTKGKAEPRNFNLVDIVATFDRHKKVVFLVTEITNYLVWMIGNGVLIFFTFQREIDGYVSGLTCDFSNTFLSKKTLNRWGSNVGM